MVFSGLLFLFFYLPAVVGIYYLLPWHFRNGWLFFVSLLFYGVGEPVYLGLLVLSITMNYLSGRQVERLTGRSRRLALTACVAGNLALLGFFKYAGFFVDTVRRIPGLSFLPVPEITLPVGISFYTFQAMSYVIDVYRGKCKAQRNFITFGTYVALFPQLIAGPIVRYVDVEAQLIRRQETPEDIDRGVKLFLAGLAKKVLLANPLGILWGELKALGPAAGTLGAWIGIAAFAMQIYFDFSGYSDMARGLGKLFGFSFVKNFDYPYLCGSITDFWRRWHISLGDWFREYVYIPLGGNRKGKLRQAGNLLIVWGLTGLWHGASWNFVLWGLYFGLLLILEKALLLPRLKKAPRALAHGYALLFVLLGWVIFDFTDTRAMGTFFRCLFLPERGLLGPEAAYWVKSFLPLLLVSGLACLPVGRTLYRRVEAGRLGWLLDGAGTALILLLCAAALAHSAYNPFLYFRF